MCQSNSSPNPLDIHIFVLCVCFSISALPNTSSISFEQWEDRILQAWVVYIKHISKFTMQLTRQPEYRFLAIPVHWKTVLTLDMTQNSEHRSGRDKLQPWNTALKSQGKTWRLSFSRWFLVRLLSVFLNSQPAAQGSSETEGHGQGFTLEAMWVGSGSWESDQ